MPITEGHEFEFQNVQNQHESCSQYSSTLKGLYNPYIFAELSLLLCLLTRFKVVATKFLIVTLSVHILKC